SSDLLPTQGCGSGISTYCCHQRARVCEVGVPTAGGAVRLGCYRHHAARAQGWAEPRALCAPWQADDQVRRPDRAAAPAGDGAATALTVAVVVRLGCPTGAALTLFMVEMDMVLLPTTSPCFRTH